MEIPAIVTPTAIVECLEFSQDTAISDLSNVSSHIGEGNNRHDHVVGVGTLPTNRPSLDHATRLDVAFAIADDKRKNGIKKVKRNLSANRFRFSGGGRKPIFS